MIKEPSLCVCVRVARIFPQKKEEVERRREFLKMQHLENIKL